MILEFDLGNTRCKWRVRDEGNLMVRGVQPIKDSFTRLDASLISYRASIREVRCASVVGADIEQRLISWCQSTLQILPVFARADSICAGVVNGYIEPARLGVDRWVGIVCAYNYLQTAFILVSFGTAVTVDLVLRDGRHVGGFIAPGAKLMLDSLMSGTCRVVTDKDFSPLNLQPGVTTNEAVQAALAAMLVGLIENGLAQLYQLEPQAQVNVVFTGGDAEKFLSFYPGAWQMPDLVLDGLAYVFNDPKNVGQ